MALHIRREETDRGFLDPPRIWLIPGRRPHAPLTELVQFSLLPLGLALALLLFGLTFQGTIGMPLSRFVHTYTDIPLPKAAPMPQTTYVYDRDGRLITTLHAGVNRTEVPLSKISGNLKDAVIALEDKDFYRESGVNFSSIARAALVNLRNGRVEQGGSTITQQYVKNVYTGGQRTISRKIKEAILAQKLSHLYTKDQILSKYLNSVYFGRAAYGAEAAALTYFGVHASKLTVRQSAFLAGLIRAPARYDPSRDPAGAKARRGMALDAMAQQGYITWDEAQTAMSKPIRLKKAKSGTTPAAYFMDYVRRALQNKYGYSGTFTGGLQVTTTLDRSMQQAAEHAIATNLRSSHDPAAALVAMDPRTGEIRALVGGRNFNRAKFNLATQARRQTGSAFKSFTLVTAFQQHIDPHSVMTGPSHITIPDPRCRDPKKGEWQVSNYADESAGTGDRLSVGRRVFQHPGVAAGHTAGHDHRVRDIGRPGRSACSAGDRRSEGSNRQSDRAAQHEGQAGARPQRGRPDHLRTSGSHSGRDGDGRQHRATSRGQDRDGPELPGCLVLRVRPSACRVRLDGVPEDRGPPYGERGGLLPRVRRLSSRDDLAGLHGQGDQGHASGRLRRSELHRVQRAAGAGHPAPAASGALAHAEPALQTQAEVQARPLDHS